MNNCALHETLLQRNKSSKVFNENTLVFWISSDRKVLNERIDKRADQMVTKGLLDEIKSFEEKYGVGLDSKLKWNHGGGNYISIFVKSKNRKIRPNSICFDRFKTATPAYKDRLKVSNRNLFLSFYYPQFYYAIVISCKRENVAQGRLGKLSSGYILRVLFAIFAHFEQVDRGYNLHLKALAQIAKSFQALTQKNVGAWVAAILPPRFHFSVVNTAAFHHRACCAFWSRRTVACNFSAVLMIWNKSCFKNTFVFSNLLRVFRDAARETHYSFRTSKWTSSGKKSCLLLNQLPMSSLSRFPVSIHVRATNIHIKSHVYCPLSYLKLRNAANCKKSQKLHSTSLISNLIWNRVNLQN